MKPRAQKILEGNPGKRPLGDEPEFAPGVGDCPKHLKGQAKKIWETLAPELEDLGLLTSADVDSFGTYVWLCGECIKLIKDIDKNGNIHTTPNGHKQPRAEVSMLREFLKLKRALAQEFGLSPTSRVRLSVAPKLENTEFEDLLD